MTQSGYTGLEVIQVPWPPHPQRWGERRATGPAP
jgi:hypothetical protein